MQDKIIPGFETKRLFLRGIRLSDSENYEKHFARWEIVQYLCQNRVPWPYPKGGAKEHIKKILTRQGVDIWFWGLFLKDKPEELIGACEIRKKGLPGNRGFWLAQQHWKKGLMTEAQYPILNYAFKELGFKKLIFDNAVQNLGSKRIKEKTGCRFIELRPQNFVNPQFTESEIWELTKQDWLFRESL